MKTPTTPRLVAIVGGSGAGKSWLADQLQRLLAPLALRVSLDDFYRDRSHLSPSRREKINFDHPRAIDWRALETALRQCREGRAIALPQYDFKSHTRAAAPVRCEPKALVLVDGLWLLRRPSVRRLFDLSIFISCPAHLRLERRLVRDMAERGRSNAAVRRQFRRAVEPMHERYVAPQERWADIVLHPPLCKAYVRQLAAQLRGQLPVEPRPARSRSAAAAQTELVYQLASNPRREEIRHD
jgi:uridine kinase